MFTIKEVKENQKVLAKEIKKLKQSRKTVRDGYVPALSLATWTYRHWHIAYCLYRGRTIEEIERTNSTENLPSKSVYEARLSEIKPKELYMEA